jgi:hypothetical protein
MRNTKDSTSKPSQTKFTHRSTDAILDNSKDAILDNYKQTLSTYDNLAIPRLIRRQERQYLRHKINNKKEYHNTHILDYKTKRGSDAHKKHLKQNDGDANRAGFRFDDLSS